MPDYRYPVRATSEQEDAVALLMNDVGVASFMQYTSTPAEHRAYLLIRRTDK